MILGGNLMTLGGMLHRLRGGWTPLRDHLGLKENKENFVFNASRDWKPMEMLLDVRRYMGATGKSGNESCSRVEYSECVICPDLSSNGAK